jgi:hypothetical protein
MMTTESSYHIKAPKQRRALDDTQIEMNDIDITLSEATKFARRLNILIKHMCPDCLNITKDILLEEAKVKHQTI